MTRTNFSIDGRELLKYLVERETTLALASQRTFDPESYKIAASGGLTEIRAVKEILRQMMKEKR